MIHECVDNPPGAQEVWTVRGQYDYYHYNCDGVDDTGWGCGYRTLQTLCSCVRATKPSSSSSSSSSTPPPVPTLRGIQEALVTMEDKPHTFLGSRDWIGSVECALVVDYLYDVPCKIIHVPSGGDLVHHMDTLVQHFHTRGAPVMMGGDADAASKGIMGISKSHDQHHLLVLDPHYVGPTPDGARLQETRMLLWRPLDSFHAGSFYNLCLPCPLVST